MIKITEEIGTCPFCGSENNVYGDNELDGDWYTFELICNDCGKKSKEMYWLDYERTEGYDDE